MVSCESVTTDIPEELIISVLCTTLTVLNWNQLKKVSIPFERVPVVFPTPVAVTVFAGEDTEAVKGRTATCRLAGSALRLLCRLLRSCLTQSCSLE